MRLPSKRIAASIFCLLALNALAAMLYMNWSIGHEAAFDRIERGWTYSQVVEAFGVEQGDYRKFAGSAVSGAPSSLAELRESLQNHPLASGTWYFDDGQADILFDQNEAVVSKMWFGPPRLNFWEKLRQLVGL